MDVSPASPVASGAASFVRASPAPTVVRPDPPPPTMPAPDHPGEAGSVHRERIVVEVGRHEGTGAQTVTVTDAETGYLLAQLPPEKVLEVIAGLLELQRQRNLPGGEHGEH